MNQFEKLVNVTKCNEILKFMGKNADKRYVREKERIVKRWV